MSEPIEFRVSTTMPLGNSSKNVIFSFSLPTADYTVTPDFDWAAGGYDISSKSDNGFTITVDNPSTNNPGNMSFHIFWDPESHGS